MPKNDPPTSLRHKLCRKPGDEAKVEWSGKRRKKREKVRGGDEVKVEKEEAEVHRPQPPYVLLLGAIGRLGEDYGGSIIFGRLCLGISA